MLININSQRNYRIFLNKQFYFPRQRRVVSNRTLYVKNQTIQELQCDNFAHDCNPISVKEV
jgi:hypothetical protein